MIEILLFIPFWYLCIIMASGINMIIYRITLPISQKIKFTFDDCFCEYCGEKIKPKRFANLPIINYILLKGKSKCCNVRIEILHPLSEFYLGTLIFVLLWLWMW